MKCVGRIRALIDAQKNRVVARTTSLFDHAPYPLTDTLDFEGDPGLFGPHSMTWPIIGDAAAFVGGIRALLVQAAHPEVVAGVADHSRYREDPLGRLSRTSAYVTATAFGAMPEVERAVAMVRRAHRPVAGMSARGRPYSADQPDLAAWVHNALTDSFLVAYRHFGARSITDDEADQFVREQTDVGRLLDVDPLPATAADLGSWLAFHPEAAPSPGMSAAIDFLRSPPLPLVVRPAYRVLYQAAVATLPPRLRSILGTRRHPGALIAGKLAVKLLRWNLGSSPSWNLALIRVGAPIPDGLFRQQLRTDRIAPPRAGPPPRGAAPST